MDKTPETPAPRTSKARAVKSADPKPSIVSTSLQQTPVAPKRKILAKKSTPAETSAPHIEAPHISASETNAAGIATSSADLNHMIATAAYYLAEQRHFAPGYEMQDWLTAEQLVRDSAHK